jgi:hypothetical protein
MDGKPARVFVSYSHKDQRFLFALEEQLKLLQRKGYLCWWTDQKIVLGDDWRIAIGDNLEEADVILLLVSIHFLASDFCWEVELARAIERHHDGTARVIPIFVRSCRWQKTPIEGLQGVPTGGRAVQKWADKHEAWTSVALGIEKAIDEWRRLQPSGLSEAK